MYKYEVSASAIVQDFNKRGIVPDWQYTVAQGILRVWLFCNSFVVELYINSNNGESIPGTLQITSKYIYVNTLSPQDIADDLISESKLGKVDLELLGANQSWLTTVDVEGRYGLPKGSVRRDIHRGKFNEDELKKVGRDWTIKADAAERLYNKNK